jgi:hypothetical protein
MLFGGSTYGGLEYLGVPATLSAAITEAADSIAATATAPASGALAKSEAADTVAGVFAITGTLAETEAADTIAATATAPVSVALAKTEAADTLAAFGYQHDDPADLAIPAELFSMAD